MTAKNSPTKVLESNYQSIINKINSDTVSLLAVSKRQPAQMIQSLYKLGQRSFGESYVQEALVKIQQLEHLKIQWHFIGSLQSNKTRHIARFFDWVQSVDSLKLLNRLNNQRPSDKSKLNVLLQLKVGGEISKRGLNELDLLTICERYQDFENLNIRGLMSIPAPSKTHQEQLFQFNICHDVFVKMQKILPVDVLSLGMSNDLEAAIKCGSTMVRVGTDIFGARKDFTKQDF